MSQVCQTEWLIRQWRNETHRQTVILSFTVKLPSGQLVILQKMLTAKMLMVKLPRTGNKYQSY